MRQSNTSKPRPTSCGSMPTATKTGPHLPHLSARKDDFMGFSRNILPGLNAKYAYITRMLSVLRDYSGGSAKADIPADEELIGCSLYVGIDSWGGSRPSLILYSPTGDVRITNTTNHYQKTWNIAELYPDKVFTGVYVECWRQNDVNKSYVICTYVTRKKIGGG